MKWVAVILSILFMCVLVLVVLWPSNELLLVGEQEENNEEIAGGEIVSESHEVIMGDFYFEPTTITIKQGDTVTWVNQGKGVHYVLTVRGIRVLDSKNIKSGETWSHTFNSVGEFEYFSPVYPNMFGTVIVE